MALKGFSEIQDTQYSKKERPSYAKLDFSNREGTAVAVRFVGPIQPIAMHWVEKRAKDGTVKRFPQHCLNFNAKENKIEENGCPFCKAGIKFSKRFYANVIDRDEQANEPKKTTRTDSEKKAVKCNGFDFPIHVKEDKSKSWSPVRVMSFPSGVAQTIKQLNVQKTSKKTGKKICFFADHPTYGFDLDITYDGSLKAKAWQIEKGEVAPLTEEDKSYLFYDLEKVFKDDIEFDKDAVIEDFNKIKDSIIYPDDEGELDFDTPAKSRGASLEDDDDEIPDFDKKKKKKKKVEDDFDDDDDFDEAPKKKKRKVEEDDDDDDFDEAPKKSKKKVDFDDEDDEDDDFDEEDDDDEDDEDFD